MYRTLAAAALLIPILAAAADSQCYGTVSNGRIERSVKLPLSGANFSAYSTIAATAGRRTFTLKSPTSDYLKAKLRFMKVKPWVRHDEHYHVDFFIPCKPDPN